MKKKSKKLVVHRETLRRLDEMSLNHVDGGASVNGLCPRYPSCAMTGCASCEPPV